jgi:hypothetical protein
VELFSKVLACLAKQESTLNRRCHGAGTAALPPVYGVLQLDVPEFGRCKDAGDPNLISDLGANVRARVNQLVADCSKYGKEKRKNPTLHHSMWENMASYRSTQPNTDTRQCIAEQLPNWSLDQIYTVMDAITCEKCEPGNCW